MTTSSSSTATQPATAPRRSPLHPRYIFGRASNIETRRLAASQSSAPQPATKARQGAPKAYRFLVRQSALAHSGYLQRMAAMKKNATPYVVILFGLFLIAVTVAAWQMPAAAPL